MRNNITEEVWAEIFGVSQSCISRYIKQLTPLVCDTTEEFRLVGAGAELFRRVTDERRQQLYVAGDA